MILNLILHAFLSVSSNGDSGSTTHYVQYEQAGMITVEPR